MKLNRRVVSLPPGNIFVNTITNQQTMHFYLENEIATYPSSCNCENHLAKTYADRLFPMKVNTLFELLFSDNVFTRNFHSAQKLTGKFF